MTGIVHGIGLLATYVVASLIVFLVVARIVRAEPSRALGLFAMTAGLGPLMISWILALLLTILPVQSDGFYLAAVALVFAGLALFGLSKRSLLPEVWFGLREMCRGAWFYAKWPSRFVLLLLVSVILLLLVLPLSLPMVSNDPLEYAVDSRLIYEHKTLEIYPFIRPDPETGFYASSSHPPGYISLLVWSHILQGGDREFGLAKWVAPMFAIYTMMALVCVLGRHGRVTALVGALLLVTTPMYFAQVSAQHIDSFRIYSFFLCFVWLAEYLSSRDPSALGLTGITLGLSLFSHTLGLIALPVAAAVVIFSPATGGRKIKTLALISGLALLIGGEHYIRNIAIFGLPVSDDEKVFGLAKLEYGDYLRHQRDVYTTSDRVVHGVFRSFSRLEYFGLSFWVFAVALVCRFGQMRQDPLSRVSLSVVLLFFCIICVTTLMGMDMMIKNERYVMTLQPFVAYLGAFLIGGWLEDFENA